MKINKNSHKRGAFKDSKDVSETKRETVTLEVYLRIVSISVNFGRNSNT